MLQWPPKNGYVHMEKQMPIDRQLVIPAMLASAFAAVFVSVAAADTEIGTAVPAVRPMATDRPDTTESPISVPKGWLQLEMTLADFTFDQFDGDRTQTFAAAPFLLKIGLTDAIDLQLGMNGYVRIDTFGSGQDWREEGAGPFLARLKVNLWGNDAGEFMSGTALALLPFVVIPSPSEDIPPRSVDGGLIVPFALELGHAASFGTMVELDFVHDDTDSIDLVGVMSATLGATLVGPLGGYVEVVGETSLRGRGDTLAFFDAGLTWELSGNARLDIGTRVGLTSESDDFGVFCGFSVRW